MMTRRPSHEGDWFLHMKKAEAMLPHMFAAHKHNCGRYELYCVRSMTWLEPEILEEFCRGGQSFHHTGGVYNGYRSDMFIETSWIRKGHRPTGITGNTESPQTMATWVSSMNATMTLTGELKKMSGGDENIELMHNEETLSRIQQDVREHLSLRATLQSSIDPLDPVCHETGALFNISSGQIVQSNVNVDRAVEIGAEQLNVDRAVEIGPEQLTKLKEFNQGQ